MNILALDASGPSAGAAVWQSGRIAYRAGVQNGHTHACELLPLAETALSILDLSLREITYIACVVGPGSFTGVRIGVATAIGLAQPLQLPCIPVDALEALAEALPPKGYVAPILDARAGQVYAALFLDGKRLWEDSAEKLPDFLDRLPRECEITFLGDGCQNEALCGAIREALGDKAVFAPESLHVVDAAATACIAARHPERAVPCDQLEPFYLRQPQAERERAARLEKEAAEKRDRQAE